MKKIFVISFFSLILLTFLLCSQNSDNVHGRQTSSQETEKSCAQEKNIVKFKTYIYTDKDGMGIEAFRMLIPWDWEFQGGIKWILDNPARPAVAEFSVKKPNSNVAIEFFPSHAFFWTNDPAFFYTFPVGSRYFGAEVMQPLTPSDALKQIIIPRHRKNISNMQIVKEEPISEIAKKLGAEKQSQAGNITSAEGAKIRIIYTENNTLIEEEIYCIVESISFQTPSIYGYVTNISWLVDYIFSFKAEKGKLEENSKTLQTIAYSFKLNPQWFNKYSQLVEYLIQWQIQQIHHIGEISKIISRTSNEISDMMMDSYNHRQAMNDKITNNFSQYIRGVEEYYNPIEQKSVELPSGYNNVWTNSLGEYILSEDPTYNPNIGSNLNWQRINKN